MQERAASRERRLAVVVLSLLLSLVLGGCDLLPWWNPPLVPTSIYAESVAVTDVCTGGNDHCDGTEAVGPPDETSPWTGHFVALGGGYIIATMEKCFTNGEGIDLLIYEVGGAGQGGVAERFDVFVSSDRITWLPVATEVKNDPDQVFASIDLAPLAGSYRYVKLVDQGIQGGRTPGADIDALEARFATQCVNPENGAIHPGDEVRTTVVDLRVREDPRLDGTELAEMYRGNSGAVTSGPVTCSHGLIWWEIEYHIGASGWSAQETATGTTCLEPLPDMQLPPDSFGDWGRTAISWAQARVEGQEDDPAWYGWCARFVANAYMNTSAWKYQDGATAGGHADDLFQELDRWSQEAGGWASAPIGSLVFFGRTEDNSHGHVGIYVGGGEIIHAWGRVKTNEIQGMLDGAEAGTEGYEGIGPYIGWAYPPERWRPVERRVVYFSNHGENAEIWKMDSDGSNGVRLTTAPESDWDPDWSPDGDTILFQSWRDGNAEIYLMNADGKSQRNLTMNPAQDAHPDWSPDGSRIVFCSDRHDPGGDLDIYVMNSDGSNVARLAKSPGIDWYPAWSPDGSRIAFSSNRSGQYQVYVMDADGTDAIQLTQGSDKHQPAWSPDGESIVYIHTRSGSWDLYIMDAGGTSSRKLAGSSSEYHRDPSWAPGDRILFSSNLHGDYEIYSIRPDGSERIQLTSNDRDDFHPAWGPSQ